MAQPTVTFEIEPISPALGARVRAIDLREPLTDTRRAALREALVEYQVLVFRDQLDLSPSDHEALGACFGEGEAHPAYPTVPGHPQINILASTREQPTRIDTWHTDMTFRERPPLGSLLRAVELPACGGDTLFASSAAAYDALPASVRAQLEPLEAIHDFAHGFRHSLAAPGGRERLAEALAQNPPRHHPVVRRHPVSGRKCLFVNPLFTTQLLGLSEALSEAMLGYLFDHLQQPEFGIRVGWRPGTLVIWDNRSTLHRPVNDYWPATRIMHRITIVGDRPRGC